MAYAVKTVEFISWYGHMQLKQYKIYFKVWTWKEGNKCNKCGKEGNKYMEGNKCGNVL